MQLNIFIFIDILILKKIRILRSTIAHLSLSPSYSGTLGYMPMRMMKHQESEEEQVSNGEALALADHDLKK